MSCFLQNKKQTKTKNKRKEREMKTRYVLLTALSALLVGAGANAATDLKVATQAYTDSHLASKDIATPTAEATGKVVTYNGTKFDYTDKGAVMPNGTADKQMLKWDATNSKWVAETGLSAGEAIEIKEDGSVNVKYDGTAVQKNGSNQLTVPEMTGVTSSTGPVGKAGLVPAPDRGNDDWVKFLRGDGTWAADRNTTYQAGAGLSQTGEGENLGLNVNVDNQTIIINDQDQLAVVPAAPYTAGDGIDITDNEVSVKKDTTVTNNALNVDATKGVSVKYDGSTVKSGTDGLFLDIDNNTITVDTNTGKLKAAQVDISGKADVATTLTGYGITDAYTKTETDSAITTKVDALNAEKSGSDAGVTVTVKEVKGLIDTVSVDVAEGAFVSDLDATVSQAAGNDGLALEVVEEDGKLKTVTGSIAANTYDAHGAASTAETNAKAYTDTEIQKLDATESQTAAAANGWLNLEVKEEDGVITSVAGSIAAETYDAYGAAADVQGDTETTVAGLESNVGDITTLTTNDTSSTVAAINELKTAADGKITKPMANCTTGHMCALVQSVDASGNATESWVDLTNPYAL